MKTKEEIFNKHNDAWSRSDLLLEDHMCEAMQEYADQEKAALREKLIKRFEEAKSNAVSLRDMIYFDGVLAVIETIDKE